MKIRTGFVSNSSSSSFIILIKNNTNRTLMFNDFLKLIYPDILPCIKQLHYNISSFDDLLFNDISFKIKPGFNKYDVNRGTDSDGWTKTQHAMFKHQEQLMNALNACHDPKKRFEWTIRLSGDLVDNIQKEDVTWEAGYGKDAYRKKKLVKSTTRKPLTYSHD